MKNSDLARAFAEGATKGKGNNMFINGDIIYSYGLHFPIAQRFSKRRAECSLEKYKLPNGKISRSTENHQDLVRHALREAGWELTFVIAKG